jgi:hypothetical protein
MLARSQRTYPTCSSTTFWSLWERLLRCAGCALSHTAMARAQVRRTQPLGASLALQQGRELSGSAAHELACGYGPAHAGGYDASTHSRGESPLNAAKVALLRNATGGAGDWGLGLCRRGAASAVRWQLPLRDAAYWVLPAYPIAP